MPGVWPGIPLYHIIGASFCFSRLPFLFRRNRIHAPITTAMTASATPTPIPAAAPFDIDPELLTLLDTTDEDFGDAERVILDGNVVIVVSEDDGIELSDVDWIEVVVESTLKPFTCKAYTTVGPVDAAVDAGTVDVTGPHGPPGVVDS